jgi:nucleotide-binding universal stress UspA family protein
MNLIVVGVDQSEGAKAALAFAHEEARLRDATLRAVHAWQVAYNGYIDYTGFGAPRPPLAATSPSFAKPPPPRSTPPYARRSPAQAT